MNRLNSLTAFTFASLMGLSSTFAQDKSPLPPPPPPIDIRPNLGGGIGPVIPIPIPGGQLRVTPGITPDGRPSVGGQLIFPIGKP
jgi:hypothetical protein